MGQGAKKQEEEMKGGGFVVGLIVLVIGWSIFDYFSTKNKLEELENQLNDLQSEIEHCIRMEDEYGYTNAVNEYNEVLEEYNELVERIRENNEDAEMDARSGRF
jgi:chromosome segregation ATPase